MQGFSELSEKKCFFKSFYAEESWSVLQKLGHDVYITSAICACNTVLLDFEQRQHKVYVQKNGKVEMMICSQAVLSLDINNVDVGLLV